VDPRRRNRRGVCAVTYQLHNVVICSRQVEQHATRSMFLLVADVGPSRTGGDSYRQVLRRGMQSAISTLKMFHAAAITSV